MARVGFLPVSVVVGILPHCLTLVCYRSRAVQRPTNCGVDGRLVTYAMVFTLAPCDFKCCHFCAHSCRELHTVARPFPGGGFSLCIINSSIVTDKLVASPLHCLAEHGYILFLMSYVVICYAFYLIATSVELTSASPPSVLSTYRQ